MKTKTHARQLALCCAMVLALGSAPAFAADREADATTAHAEVKAGNQVAKAKIENPAAKPAAKPEKAETKAEAKKEHVAETTSSEAAKADDMAVSATKAEETITAKPGAFSAPAPVPSAAPAPQAPPQGLFQKFRSLFGAKKSQAPSSVVTPVAPATAPTNPAPKSEALPLGSPPNAVTAPEGAEAQKGAPEPKNFVPPALPIQPSLVAPLAPAPSATSAVRAPDPPNLKQAEKVAKLFNLKQRLQGPLGPITMLMMMEVDRANPGQMVTTQKAIAEAQTQFAADHEQEMQEDTARFYAENFTADELQQLKEFYESSAGQKLMKNGDELQRRQSIFGNELAMKNVNLLREEVLKTVKKYDLKPPKAPEAHK